MSLVVVDVAAGDGGLIQMPDERLLAQRQRLEAVRIDLHHRRVVDGLEEILALAARPARPSRLGFRAADERRYQHDAARFAISHDEYSLTKG